MTGVAFVTLSNGQIAVVTAAGCREFDDFKSAADYAARPEPRRLPTAIAAIIEGDEAPEPNLRLVVTASARVSLACGHVQEFTGWNYYLIPRVGDRLWCWKCEPGDERAVTQVEIL